MKKKQKWDPHMKVYCSSTKDEQELDFFLQDKNNVHFLFRHPYRRSTYVFYHNGVILEKALDYSRANKDDGIINAIKRTRCMLKYLASMNEISIIKTNNYKKSA